MKIGITCGGIGIYANGAFVQSSARAAEYAGFAHYWLPDHVVQFSEYPQSVYPYAAGSGLELPEQNTDAPLQFDDDRELYGLAGLAWTSQGEAAMQGWEARDPRHKRGSYGYKLEDYGWSAARVEDAFGPIATAWRGQ